MKKLNSNHSPIVSDKSDERKNDKMTLNSSGDSSRKNPVFNNRQSDDFKSKKKAPFKKNNPIENEVIYSRKKNKKKNIQSIQMVTQDQEKKNDDLATIDDTNESKFNEPANDIKLDFNHNESTNEKKNLNEVKVVSDVKIIDQKNFKTNIMVQSKNNLKFPNIKYQFQPQIIELVKKEDGKEQQKVDTLTHIDSEVSLNQIQKLVFVNDNQNLSELVQILVPVKNTQKIYKTQNEQTLNLNFQNAKKKVLNKINDQIKFRGNYQDKDIKQVLDDLTKQYSDRKNSKKNEIFQSRRLTEKVNLQNLQIGILSESQKSQNRSSFDKNRKLSTENDDIEQYEQIRKRNFRTKNLNKTVTVFKKQAKISPKQQYTKQELYFPIKNKKISEQTKLNETLSFKSVLLNEKNQTAHASIQEKEAQLQHTNEHQQSSASINPIKLTSKINQQSFNQSKNNQMKQMDLIKALVPYLNQRQTLRISENLLNQDKSHLMSIAEQNSQSSKQVIIKTQQKPEKEPQDLLQKSKVDLQNSSNQNSVKSNKYPDLSIQGGSIKKYYQESQSFSIQQDSKVGIFNINNQISQENIQIGEKHKKLNENIKILNFSSVLTEKRKLEQQDSTNQNMNKKYVSINKDSKDDGQLNSSSKQIRELMISKFGISQSTSQNIVVSISKLMKTKSPSQDIHDKNYRSGTIANESENNRIENENSQQSDSKNIDQQKIDQCKRIEQRWNQSFKIIQEEEFLRKNLNIDSVDSFKNVIDEYIEINRDGTKETEIFQQAQLSLNQNSFLSSKKLLKSQD